MSQIWEKLFKRKVKPLFTNEQIALIKTSNLEPGDIIVLFHPGKLTKEALANIKKSVLNFIGHKVIVLEEGMRLEILREKLAAELNQGDYNTGGADKKSQKEFPVVEAEISGTD